MSMGAKLLWGAGQRPSSHLRQCRRIRQGIDGEMNKEFADSGDKPLTSEELVNIQQRDAELPGSRETVDECAINRDLVHFGLRRLLRNVCRKSGH